MERKLTEEERREFEIVSLGFELQDEECEEEVSENTLRDEYYQLAKETLFGKEDDHGAR